MITIVELNGILLTIAYVDSLSKQYEYSRVGSDQNGVNWMLSAMTLNAVLLVSLIVITANFKASYQSSAKQMRQKQGILATSANFGTILNIVGLGLTEA